MPKRIVLTQQYIQGYSRHRADGTIQQVTGHYENRKEKRSPNECDAKIQYKRTLAIIDSALMVTKDEARKKQLGLAREKVAKLLDDFLQRHPACRGAVVQIGGGDGG